jgi:uncharacterized protein
MYVKHLYGSNTLACQGIKSVTTVNHMAAPIPQRIQQDEAKRISNLDKHGLDFMDSVMVPGSPYRLDVDSVRGNELRMQSFAYVFEVLTVLPVAYVEREDALRIVSFPTASDEERRVYHEWLENDFQDAG